MQIVDGDKLFKDSVDYIIKNENLYLAIDNLSKLLNKTLHNIGEADTLFFYIACANMKLKNNAMAIVLFKEAMRHRPDFLEAINNLGYVYKAELMIDEARKCFTEVLRLVELNKDIIPVDDQADYLTNLGSIIVATGEPDKALELFNQADKLSSKNPMNKWNRSLVLLEKGDYERGFDEYDFGDRAKLSHLREYGIKGLPDWNGSFDNLDGDLIVYGEQGIGDEMMFANVLPDLLASKTPNVRIVLDAHPRLKEIFRHSFPEIAVYGTRKVSSMDQISWVKYHRPVAKIAIGSLCKYYRKTPESFLKEPYLKADPEFVLKYAELLSSLGDKPKIGISWKGGTLLTNKAERQTSLDMWLPLLKSIDADWISLQYDKDASAEIDKFRSANDGLVIEHWQDIIDDYDKTAGLVSNLDLIISVPQSVVHLAGALGTPTFQLTPKRAMWQMGVYGQDMPWYGCVRSIWQKEDGNWSDVIERVKDELCNLLATPIAV